jgi:hypothetical protein
MQLDAPSAATNSCAVLASTVDASINSSVLPVRGSWSAAGTGCVRCARSRGPDLDQALPDRRELGTRERVVLRDGGAHAMHQP